MRDPELLRMATEQMRRMSPEDLARMQQMMTPDMMKMAEEQMKNLRPDDLKFAAQQMSNMDPKQVASMASGMGGGGGSGGAGANSALPFLNQRLQYEYNASVQLKNEGNILHGLGKFQEAIQKYEKALSNLGLHTSAEAASLRQQCTLNLMSCFLKTHDFLSAISLGNQVLAEDKDNVKALYRRGMANRGVSNLKAAVEDLGRAHELSPNDETLAASLEEAKKDLKERETSVTSAAPKKKLPKGLFYGTHAGEEVTIEDVPEEDLEKKGEKSRSPPSANGMQSRNQNQTRVQNQNRSESQGGAEESSMPTSPRLPSFPPPADAALLRENPEIIKNMHSMIRHIDANQLAAMSGGSISPEVAKMMSSLMQSMSPEQFQEMVQVAATLNPPPGVPPPTFLSSSADSRSSAPPLNPSLPTPLSSPLTHRVPSSRVQEGVVQPPGEGRDGAVREEGSGGQGGRGGGGAEVDGLDDLEAKRRILKDPAMMNMMSSMMRNMSPEDMVAVSAQMGVKMTLEDAREAKVAMEHISADKLAFLMTWADRVQRGTIRTKQMVGWLFARPALVLALLALLLAVLFHCLGFIG